MSDLGCRLDYQPLLNTPDSSEPRKSSLPWMLPPGGGGVLPHMGYIGMCRCEGYGFQAIYSSIGYINQSVCI